MFILCSVMAVKYRHADNFFCSTVHWRYVTISRNATARFSTPKSPRYIDDLSYTSVERGRLTGTLQASDPAWRTRNHTVVLISP